jgi:phosphoglycerate dehydrogenase-like enzyme
VASQKQEIMEAKHREHLLVERLNTVELKVSKYDSWSNNDNNNEYQTETVVKSVEPSKDVISEHINQTTESNKMISYHQNLNRKLKHEKFSKGL